MESRSIDLAVICNSHIAIWEVKTITNDNIEAQLSKALFQVLRYGMALTEDGYNDQQLGIIIEGEKAESVVAAYSQLFNRIGIKLYAFCWTKQWPQRVSPSLTTDIRTCIGNDGSV